MNKNLELLVKGGSMVAIAMLVPWADLFGEAVKTGVWPPSVQYPYRGLLSALAGCNTLIAFLSGSYERSKQKPT